MPPLVVNANNTSTTPRDLYTSKGTKLPISDGVLVTVNHHLDGTTDTKIQINTTDVRRYLLKYDSADKSVNKILINDALGRTNKVADTRLWAKNEYESLYIEICEETIKISTSEKNLRLYKPNDELTDRYYKTVIASNNENGGITLTGVDDANVARSSVGDEDEVEVEGEPSKTN